MEALFSCGEGDMITYVSVQTTKGKSFDPRCQQSHHIPCNPLLIIQKKDAYSWVCVSCQARLIWGLSSFSQLECVFRDTQSPNLTVLYLFDFAFGWRCWFASHQHISFLSILSFVHFTNLGTYSLQYKFSSNIIPKLMNQILVFPFPFHSFIEFSNLSNSKHAVFL